MAEKAGHVTMLQRSPTYVTALPSGDKVADWLREHLPPRAAYSITRWKNVTISMLFYVLARKRPDFFRNMLSKAARKKLGPEFDMAHFTPRYNPWDQRLCLIPDADLFKSLKAGKSSVVTDEITGFTSSGIDLKSGRRLEADIIVTATGLNMKLMSGLELVVDGAPIDMSTLMTYKGMMYSDVPNLASVFGYTNASWTLKADLVCEYVCRLLNHMDRKGFRQCTPRNGDPSLQEEPWVSFSSGYIQRGKHIMPKSAVDLPWRLNQDYRFDRKALATAPIDDGVLKFDRVEPHAEQQLEAAE
jgi:cation diffusion facilitator CzcD-associated flavoprotein CzcO